MFKKNYRSIWACPVCKLPLMRPLNSNDNKNQHWLCLNKHSYDIAKENYINLLLPNQKRSSLPGDTKCMVTSRQKFLAEGYYDLLAKKIISLTDKMIGTDDVVLDCGCGDGYYLRNFLTEKITDHIFGIDISKEAVKFASRQTKGGDFAVASNFDLPVLSNSVDCILRIFSPGSDMEVARILKNTGILITVSPGGKHLWSLKKLLYQEAKEHTPSKSPANLSLLKEEKLSYQIQINSTQKINELISMTPLYWRTNKKNQTKLKETESLNTEVNFIIRVYCPSKNNAWTDASIKSK